MMDVGEGNRKADVVRGVNRLVGVKGPKKSGTHAFSI